MTVLDGKTKETPMSDAVRDSLGKILGGHDVNWLELKGKTVKPCMGCFGCWVSTPGLCVITSDDSTAITRKMVNCDLVIELTPVTFGGYSSELKKVLDRSIPLLLPYFRLFKGEIHHYQRYEKIPSNLTIGYQEKPDRESKEIFEGLAKRNALNMNPPKHACVILDSPEGIEPKLADALGEVL